MTDEKPPVLRLFPDAATLFAQLSAVIGARLSSAVADGGEATFVASGGETPGGLYDLLAKADLPWARVTVVPSDERWVPQGGEGSNEKLLNDRLLQDKAAAARRISLRTTDDAPVQAVPETSGRIAALPRPFEVTLLGMGSDSHTASLYPHAPGLTEALDTSRPELTAAVSPTDAAGSNLRLSLSLRALLDSRLIVILIRGEAKLAVYRQALAGQDVTAAPVRAILHQATTPVEVWWAP